MQMNRRAETDSEAIFMPAHDGVALLQSNRSPKQLTATVESEPVWTRTSWRRAWKEEVVRLSRYLASARLIPMAESINAVRFMSAPSLDSCPPTAPEFNPATFSRTGTTLL